MADIYGQLIKAQFEVLAADIGTPPTGVAYFNSVSLLPKFYDSAAWRTLVTLDNTQTMTNKTLTSPLIDDYFDVNEEAVPANPAAGKQRLYIKSADEKLYRRNSAGVETSIEGGATAGQLPGQTSGVAIGAGFIGEIISSGAMTETSSTSTTYADVTGASITLSAGVWMIHANFLLGTDTASSATVVKVTTAANAEVPGTLASLRSIGTTLTNMFVAQNISAPVNISASTTYKLRIAAAGKGILRVNNDQSFAGDTEGSFYAIRVA